MKQKIIQNRKPIVILAVSTLLYFSAVFYLPGRDAMDNFLGGKLIFNGQALYRDFFSHHSPGMYYISAIIYPLTFGSMFWYRFIFNALIYGLLVANTVLIKRRFSVKSALLYFFLSSAGHVAAISYQVIAESALAQLVPLLLLLVVFSKKPIKMTSTRGALGISLAMFMVPFINIAYAPLAAVLYLVLLKRQLEESRPDLYRAAGLLFALALPYFVFALYLLVSGSLEDFVFGAYTFNTKYYSPMVGKAAGSFLAELVGLLINLPRELLETLSSPISLLKTINVFLITAPLLLAGFVWRKAGAFMGVAFVFILLLSYVRNSIYSESLFETSLISLSQHAAVYLTLLFLSASILLSKAGKSRSKSTLLLVYPAALIMLTSYAWLGARNYIFAQTNDGNYYTYSQEAKSSELVRKVNAVSGPDSKVWLAPGQFKEQLYLDSERATSFTFYLPWLDSSPELRSKLLSELDQERPKLIYLEDFSFKGQKYEYAELELFLDQYYFTVDSDEYQHFWFNNTQEKEIREYIQSE